MPGTRPGMTSRDTRGPGAIPAFFLRVVIVREGGRSSTPRRLDSIADACDYWMPAFAGVTALV